MGLDEQSDEEIFIRCIEARKSGDEWGDESKRYTQELYRRFYKQAYNLARFYGLRHNDAEDAVQDVLIKILLYCDNFDRSKKFKPWFFKSILNKVRDKHRENKRKSVQNIDLYLDISQEENGNNYEKLQLRDGLHRIINKLPEKYKEVLLLNWNNHLDFEEIGKALGIQSRQARNRLDQALAMLRELGEEL